MFGNGLVMSGGMRKFVGIFPHGLEKERVDE